MDFRFHSEGVMLFGMPYVARLTVNKYGEFQNFFLLFPIVRELCERWL